VDKLRRFQLSSVSIIQPYKHASGVQITAPEPPGTRTNVTLETNLDRQDEKTDDQFQRSGYLVATKFRPMESEALRGVAVGKTGLWLEGKPSRRHRVLLAATQEC
jgi:hypothetical protein